MFGLILFLYLVAGVLYATLTPPWQAPDEPAHYNYVRYLATHRSFPELVLGCYDQPYLDRLKAGRFPPELSIDGICYEFHQPPFYYLLATPIFTLSDGSLLALRLFSVGLGAGVVVLAFFIGRTIFPDQPAVALGTMAFVAFIPMHLAMLASVNNDALAELVLAAILLLLSRRLIRPAKPSAGEDLLLGGLVGLGLVTKATIYIALPLVAVTVWLAAAKDRPRMARQAALIFGLALLIALPWYLRNGMLYGNFDLLGLARHDAVVVGQLRTADYLAEVGWVSYAGNFITTTFHSFWGQFGWMAVPMDGQSYLLLLVLTLMALGGLIGFGQGVLSFHPDPRYALSTRQQQALGLMALAVILVGLAYGGYNLTFVQFQGRYLFPALIPLALFFSLGVHEAFAPRWSWWLAGGLTLALAWIVISGLFTGYLHKWAVLIVGFGLALALLRARLTWFCLVPASWLMTACYLGLGVLALLSPFWFVIPYLSP